MALEIRTYYSSDNKRSAMVMLYNETYAIDYYENGKYLRTTLCRGYTQQQAESEARDMVED